MISGIQLSDVSIQKLKQRNMGEEDINAFSNLLLEAQGRQSSALDYLGRLSKAELEILQNAHSLADPINVSVLSEEGARNLLTQPDNQGKVDLNNDGIVEVGLAKTIHFPPVNAPQFVKDAWEKATEGMAEFDKAFLQLSMHHSIYGTGINIDGEQRPSNEKALSPSLQWSALGIEKLMDARYSNLEFRVAHDGWTDQNKMLKQFYEQFENELSKGISSARVTSASSRYASTAPQQTVFSEQPSYTTDKRGNEGAVEQSQSTSLDSLVMDARTRLYRQKLEEIDAEIEAVTNASTLSEKERHDKLMALHADKESTIEAAREWRAEGEKRKFTLTRSQRLSENLREREIKNSIHSYNNTTLSD